MVVRRRVALSLIALIIVTMAAGCATTGGMRSVPLDVGVARTFQAPYERVLRAARDATLAAGFTIDSYEQVDSTTAVIVGKTGASAWSWGEFMRMVVNQTDLSHVVVRVYTRRALATNVTARENYADTIFQNIELSLK